MGRNHASCTSAVSALSQGQLASYLCSWVTFAFQRPCSEGLNVLVWWNNEEEVIGMELLQFYLILVLSFLTPYKLCHWVYILLPPVRTGSSLPPCHMLPDCLLELSPYNVLVKSEDGGSEAGMRFQTPLCVLTIPKCTSRLNSNYLLAIVFH